MIVGFLLAVLTSRFDGQQPNFPGQLQSSAPARNSEGKLGGEIVSDMLAHYHGVQSLSGQISYTITASAVTGKSAATIQTDIAYQLPSRLYLKQQEFGAHANTWLITSDGEKFSYGFPEGLKGYSNRLIEEVKGNDVPHIYAAGSRSIGDRSAPLGILVSWKDELKRIIARWATCTVIAEDKIGDKAVTEVGGAYREGSDKPIIGSYQLSITKAGDLLRYIVRQKMLLKDETNPADPGHQVDITNEWNVQVTLGAQPDARLFTVVR